VVERLLNITGPVTIDERTFNSDSFHADLQLYVERDYAADNIPREDRKAIIETIARQLIKQFISLEGGGVAALNNIFLASLQDRSIVLWFEDSEAQKVVSAAGWDGRVRSTDGDFIMLVDANLASLKTDPFVRRAVHYQVLETEDGLMARLDIDYRHEGTFSFTTTRYRSFTRVLVPAGSKLLRVEGAELGDRATSVGPVFEQTEADKNSFGAFISVEPGQSHRLSFVYQLPSHLLDQLKANTYTLLAQRQAGTQNYPLIVDITARRPIVPKILTESVEQLGSQRVRFTGTLAKDQYIEIK